MRKVRKVLIFIGMVLVLGACIHWRDQFDAAPIVSLLAGAGGAYLLFKPQKKA